MCGCHADHAPGKTYPNLFRVPVHDHELKHTGGGNKLATMLSVKDAAAGRGMTLMWGEDILIPKAVRHAGGAPMSLSSRPGSTSAGGEAGRPME